MSASPGDDYLWRNQMGRLGNAPIRKSFIPSCFCFLCCPPPGPRHTWGRAVFCVVLCMLSCCMSTLASDHTG